MKGFQKPERTARDGYSRFLYVDGDQAAASLSAFLGGDVEEARSTSTEEANKGLDISGGLSVSGIKAEAGGSKNRKLVYEEEVIRKKTGYSTITALLRKLHEINAIGRMPTYGPEEYEQIEEGELYEFKADIRLHPFHQFVSLTQGWAEAGENFGQDTEQFSRMVREIENTFYGKNKAQRAIAIFADIEGCPPEYRLLMPIKVEQLLVSLDDFSGKATFVAQINTKIGEGRKYLAARMVRNTPIIAPAEENMMLGIIPALRKLPGALTEGITINEDDVVLRKPAVTLKPLCVYKA